MASSGEKPTLLVNGKRADGRALNEVRPIKIQAGILNNADGSAYLEWGKNRVLAAVYGPKECIPRHDINPYKAVIHCRYSMAPFSSLEEHGRTGPNRRSTELSKVIREVFEHVIFTELFPKTAIDIFIEILQGDGGTRCAGITAASVALANAGIPMKDLVAAVAVGKIDGNVGIDFSKDEDNFGESDLPLAISPRNNEVLLLQMDGLLTTGELNEAFSMAFEAVKRINVIQSDAIKAVYKNGEDR